MSGKKPLVKQRVTYGSLGNNSRGSEEDLSLKQTKRVSFEGGSISSDADSDVENSFGRSNRSLEKGDANDGLFRDSSFGERQNSSELIKGGTKSMVSKDKYSLREQEDIGVGQPRPVPRHHPPISPRHSQTAEGRSVVTSQQSFNESNDDESAITWPTKAKDRNPVPVPRSSSQQQQMNSSTLSTTSPRPPPRSRPGLSPREGKVKLLVTDTDAEHDRTSSTKDRSRPEAPLRRKQSAEEFDQEHQNSKRPPPPSSRPGLSPRDGKVKLLVTDTDAEYDRTRHSKERPEAPLRRKQSTEELDQEHQNSKRPPPPSSRPGLSPREAKVKLLVTDTDAENDRTRHSKDRPEVPLRRKQSVEELDQGHQVNKKTQVRNRTNLLDEDEHDRNRYSKDRPEAPLRRKQSKEDLDRGHQVNEKPQVHSRRTLSDDMHEPEHNRNRYSKDRPEAPLRRKQSTEELHQGHQVNKKPQAHSRRTLSDERENDRNRYSKDRPEAPLRRKQSTEELDHGHQLNKKPQARRRTTLLDDGDDDNDDDDDQVLTYDRTGIERDGNLRQKSFEKIQSRPVISVTKDESSEESEDEMIIDPGRDSITGLFRRQRTEEEDLSFERTEKEDKSVHRLPRPSPRSHLSADRSLKADAYYEDKETLEHSEKRPKSVPTMKKATSLETLQSKQASLKMKELLHEVDSRAQKTPLKKSLTPQRPQSAKKSSLMTKLKKTDITETFEEHVPEDENTFDSSGDRGLFGKRSVVEQGTVWDTPHSHRPRPMKASQGINEMTRSPHLKETFRTHQTEGKDSSRSSRGKSPTPKRASSMTNLRGHSPEPWGEDTSRESSRRDSLDTSSIRQAVYDDWLLNKSSRLKEQAASKASETQKLKEKEEEERQRKKLAKRAFDSWNEKKQEENKEKSAKKKESMDKELEKRKEKNLKARDAKKYFESWKVKKDEELKEQHHKKREENHEKKKTEEDQKQEKRVNAKKVFENWKNTKDEKIKEEMKKKRKEGKDDEMKEEDEKYERSIQSAERYQAWVEKKGKPRRHPPPPTLTQRGWCPSGRKSGNAIPEKVGGVIQAPLPNRSRTLSGTQLSRASKF